MFLSYKHKPHKAISGFVSRYLIGQGKMEWYMQIMQKEGKLQTKNISPRKVVHQKQKQDENSSQTNKSWGSSASLWLDLSHNKCWMGFVQAEIKGC